MAEPFPHAFLKKSRIWEVSARVNKYEPVKEAATHGVVALLYALGLTLTLFQLLELTAYVWTAIPVMVAVIVLLAGSTLKRWAGITLAAVSTVGVGVWLLAGGAATVVQVLRGITLHLSGVMAALPLVAGETAMLIAVLAAVLSFLLTFRAAGAYPAITVLLMALLLIWLGNRAALLWWLLPSVAAALALLALSNHQELSLRRVLPAMLLAVLAAFAVIPTGGVTIEPLKNAADTLRQRIFDYFFFTEPRDVFSLALEGYYPQGQNQLGGPVKPSERPVMQVQTNRRTYLRGAIKNEYTGRAWVDTTGGRRYLWTGLRWKGVRSETFNMALPAAALGTENSLMRESPVSVRMLADSTSSLFVPQRVRQLTPGGDLVPYFNVGSEIFATRNLQAGDTWTVQAPLVMAGDAGLDVLLNACAQTEDPQYAALRETYTVLPEHLQQELYDLAHRVTDAYDTEYEKAFALQNYLSRNFRYTLDVAPQPVDLDFVTNFLLQTKEGYCTYFATAMTVLCRMVGLPARYVEGYAVEPDAEGHAVATGLDGHAWTEVYFSGFGWLTFDATPRWNSGGAAGNGTASDEEPPPEEEPTPTPTQEPDSETPTPDPNSASTIAPPEESPTPEPTDEPSDAPSPEPTDTPEPDAPPEQPPVHRYHLWWLWLLLLLAAVIALRIFLTQPKQAAARAKDEAGRWMAWTQALYDALEALGLPRRLNESPMAYMERLDASGALPVPLGGLGQGEAAMFYGRAIPQAEATLAVAQAYTALWTAMPPLRRVRLTLRRAFLPKRKLDFTQNGQKG